MDKIDALRKPALWLLGFCLYCGMVHAELAKSEIEQLFKEGTEYFHKANEILVQNMEGAKELYRKAALRMERIVDEGGLHNGKLYYNIGNIYFRMGDLGRAILYYRRAELFTPNDVNLRQNLAFARSKRIDKIEEAAKSEILKTIFFWHYDVSLRTRTTIFILSFALVCLMGSLWLFAKKPGIAWTMSVSLILAVLFAASLCVDFFTDASNAGVIVDKEVIARQGDSETYEPSFKGPLHAGTEFTVAENRGDWCYVALADDRKCWLPAKAIAKLVTK